ncbi:hypothetical protein NSQ59_07525 [Margalitia sp. FSL K6-0131]
MFTSESVVAKTWAKAVLKGEKKVEEVPSLFNLVEVVSRLVEGGETNV